jgi:FkbM family methyltransferase
MGKLSLLNSLLQGFGFEVVRYNKGTNGMLRRKALFEKYRIDLIVDVGANTGIYGKEIRKAGYQGGIVSFEPLKDAFEKLNKNVEKDPNWKAYNFALGLEDGQQLINVSGNSHSSSILDILDTHTKAEPTASYVSKQEITIRKLDSVLNDIKGTAKEIYLKVDTQGFELNVLKGAINSLKNIHTIELEMSLKPLYTGQPLYSDIMNFLHSYNYTLIDVEPGFADLQTGTLLQFDGIFRTSELVA